MVSAAIFSRRDGRDDHHDIQSVEWIRPPYLDLFERTAIAGMNGLVLILGIATTGSDRPVHGGHRPVRLARLRGLQGSPGNELIIITLMAGGMLELIRLMAEWTISSKLTKHVNSKREPNFASRLWWVSSFLHSQQYDSHHHSGTACQRYRYPLQGGQTQVQVFWILSRVSSGNHPLRSTNADCCQTGFPCLLLRALSDTCTIR